MDLQASSGSKSELRRLTLDVLPTPALPYVRYSIPPTATCTMTTCTAAATAVGD